jgi:hypothetical protein
MRRPEVITRSGNAASKGCHRDRSRVTALASMKTTMGGQNMTPTAKSRQLLAVAPLQGIRRAVVNGTIVATAKGADGRSECLNSQDAEQERSLQERVPPQ